MTPIETIMDVCVLYGSRGRDPGNVQITMRMCIYIEKEELVYCELLCYRDSRQCENIMKTSNGTNNHKGMKAEELNNHFSVK